MTQQLSLGKWAEKWNVKPANLKKVVTELQIEPDSKKGSCSYYSEATLNEAKKRLTEAE